jgi:hypothetical protein
MYILLHKPCTTCLALLVYRELDGGKAWLS